jgi:hypothetical protein
MSDYFTEVSSDTFLILFKSKVDDDKFFKYVEKNFKKWGMVNIDYDKKEKTIIGKSPALALSFWSKFPVKLSTVGLRSIIISKGDEKNSFLINVNTNEVFGNSHTIRFPTFFSKEINTKFARVIDHKLTNKESENSDTEDNINRKKVTKNKKLTAEEKIANVKKKSPSKMIWWISGVVGFVVLLMVLGSGGNNSSNLSVNDEQKIRQYIQQRAEMKRNCDGMWSLRGIGGKSSSEIIAMCKPLGYDVKSKTWRYEPESVKKVLRKYGIYD